MKKLASLVASFFLATSAYAVDYIMQKTVPSPYVSPIVTSPWGSWQGFIATPLSYQPAGATTHTLVFEFETPDYFSADNTGHFPIAVRGDATSDTNGDGVPELRGRGIILGSVHVFYLPSGRCDVTSKPNTIAIEAFWTGGNCLYGPSTEGPSLQNNKRYKVQIKSRPVFFYKLLTEYTLWERGAGGSWTQLIQRSQTDDENPAPQNLGGWWLAEVFSSHTWTFYIYNLQDSWQ